MCQRCSKRVLIDGITQNRALQWLNPHNWYLMMFSPSTIHVLPFDPHHGNDNARVYAGKYASKPEKARITSAPSPVFPKPLLCY